MNYYPIGTVVTLVNGDRPLMIYGRKQINGDTGAVWDYVSCLYPEGYMNEEHNYFFQHEEIENIYHDGLMSEYDDKMQEILNAN